jgi:diguanylate cyclase (GGDEF)-like protein
MIARLRQAPRLAIAVLSGCLVVAVGLADYSTGEAISLSAFYVLVVLLATFLLGRRAGLIVSLAAAGVTIAGQLAPGASLSQPWIAYWNGAIRLGLLVIVVFITGAFLRERVSAREDPVSGLANRHGFMETAAREVLRARRYTRPLTLIMLDLDQFKAVNDLRGHREGDAVLRAVGEALTVTVRATDVTARFGGDEFAVLLPETGADQGRVTAERIRKEVGAAMEKRRSPVTFSAGVVTFTRPAASVDEVMNRADALMYAAKAAGKDTIRYEEVA